MPVLEVNSGTAGYERAQALGEPSNLEFGARGNERRRQPTSSVLSFKFLVQPPAPVGAPPYRSPNKSAIDRSPGNNYRPAVPYASSGSWPNRMIQVERVFGSPERQLRLARDALILTNFRKGSAGSVHIGPSEGGWREERVAMEQRSSIVRGFEVIQGPRIGCAITKAISSADPPRARRRLVGLSLRGSPGASRRQNCVEVATIHANSIKRKLSEAPRILLASDRPQADYRAYPEISFSSNSDAIRERAAAFVCHYFRSVMGSTSTSVTAESRRSASSVIIISSGASSRPNLTASLTISRADCVASSTAASRSGKSTP
jgi:hypothetical protein